MTTMTIKASALASLMAEEIHKIDTPRRDAERLNPVAAGANRTLQIPPADNVVAAGKVERSGLAPNDDVGKKMQEKLRERLREKLREKLRAFFMTVLPPLIGFALLIGIWDLATLKASGLPGPLQTWKAAEVLFGH